LETTFLSTQYSQFKKKREKSIGSEGYQEPEESSFGLIRADPFVKSVGKSKKKDEPGTPASQNADDKKRKSNEDTPAPADKKTRV
jgi:hypothetical protein